MKQTFENSCQSKISGHPHIHFLCIHLIPPCHDLPCTQPTGGQTQLTTPTFVHPSPGQCDDQTLFTLAPSHPLPRNPSKNPSTFPRNNASSLVRWYRELHGHSNIGADRYGDSRRMESIETTASPTSSPELKRIKEWQVKHLHLSMTKVRERIII